MLNGERARRLARMAGAFYLVTIVAGVFAEMFVRGRLIVRDSASATAANIMAHETLYRLGLAADLLMLTAYVAVTLLLYIVLQPVSRPLSLAAALFSLVGIAVLAVNSLNHVAPLVLLGKAGYLDPLGSAQLQALSMAALKLHARGYAVSGVFFGMYCVLIGWLAYRSGFMPRLIGVLMLLGGAGYLINSFGGMVFPAAIGALPDMTLFGGIAELALTLWLLAKGLDASKWRPCE